MMNKFNELLNQVTDGYVVAVDFDNTLFITDYPHIKEPIYNIINLIKKYKEKGAIIILWTCRENKDLEIAKEYCKQYNIPIDYYNENSPTRINEFNNDSRKIGADIYIDDLAINSLNLYQLNID